MSNIEIVVPEIFDDLFDDYRYYVYYGGRGSGKSHSIARFLVYTALSKTTKILCARELQNSITESVYVLLKEIIYSYGFQKWFTIKLASIECKINRSVFIFKGLAHNIESVKSTEGVDIVWIEEADKVSQSSWDILIPTIRKSGSRLIITFNPTHEDDPVYQMFIVTGQHDMIARKVNYSDNDYFPEVLEKERLHMMATDYEKYLHVWEGELRTVSDAQVFKGKFVVEEFSSEGVEEFYHGMDFGFANDPSTVVRCFIRDRKLYIDKEAYGHHIEINDLGKLINKVIANKYYKIKADCARPETISYLRNEGWNIEGAKKWPESIAEGIEYLRGFEKIVIHPTCIHAIEEFKRYSFKIDKRTNDVLPIVIDDYNHVLDSIRYSIDSLIKNKKSIYDEGVM
jgi:phage terminase large subunit